tara:strand:- start:37 stop:339 length:303 start_codon:yes stop_codon:yes gene_type:complete
MPYFIKTETIKRHYLSEIDLKSKTIKEHKLWVKKLIDQGFYIKSGFLVDEDQVPGAGGFLIIKCESFGEAEKIIEEDPMIKNNLVDWKLNEWIIIAPKKN